MLIIKNPNAHGIYSTQEHINFTTNSHQNTNWSIKHTQSAIKIKQNIIELHKTSQNNPKIDPLRIPTHVHSNPEA